MHSIQVILGGFAVWTTLLLGQELPFFLLVFSVPVIALVTTVMMSR